MSLGLHARMRMLLVVLCALLGVSAISAPTAGAALDRAELNALTQINKYRAAHGLPRLVAQRTLVRAAEWMSVDMARHGYFSHTDRLGRNSATRIRSLGYPRRAWAGENLAAGFSSPGMTVQQWKTSPAHDANLRHRAFRAVGIARVYRPGSRYGWYWTLTFGSAR